MSLFVAYHPEVFELTYIRYPRTHPNHLGAPPMFFFKKIQANFEFSQNWLGPILDLFKPFGTKNGIIFLG